MDSSPLDDDEEDGQSLTRQLAETAQGVREMSKELGKSYPMAAPRKTTKTDSGMQDGPVSIPAYTTS